MKIEKKFIMNQHYKLLSYPVSRFPAVETWCVFRHNHRSVCME